MRFTSPPPSALWSANTAERLLQGKRMASGGGRFAFPGLGLSRRAVGALGC